MKKLFQHLISMYNKCQPQKANMQIQKETKLQPVKTEDMEEHRKDTLTGCLTRDSIEQSHFNFPYTLVFMDLDNFKPVNDVLGHDAGDSVLKAFGQMLLDMTKRSDWVIRYGGDEFVLILPNTSIGGAKKLTEILLYAKWSLYAPDTGNIKVSISAGISSNKENIFETVKAADQAMYMAKKKGKNRIVVADFITSGHLKKSILKQADGFLIMTGDCLQTVKEYAGKHKKIVVIDASTGKLACSMGMDLDTMWKHDWRIGLSAVPAKLNKKIEIYSVPLERDSITWENRDFKAMEDIIKLAIQRKKGVLINTCPDMEKRISDIIVGCQ